MSVRWEVEVASTEEAFSCALLSQIAETGSISISIFRRCAEGWFAFTPFLDLRRVAAAA
jgi:hypothetical protein